MYNKEDIYEPYEDFEWEKLYESEEGTKPDQYEQEAIILCKILEFLHPPRAKPMACLARLFALILYVKPDWLGKSSPTQVEVARILGISKSVMNAHVNEVRKYFGFQIAGMRDQKARDKFSKLCAARATELAESRRISRERKKSQRGESEQNSGNNTA